MNILRKRLQPLYLPNAMPFSSWLTEFWFCLVPILQGWCPNPGVKFRLTETSHGDPTPLPMIAFSKGMWPRLGQWDTSGNLLVALGKDSEPSENCKDDTRLFCCWELSLPYLHVMSWGEPNLRVTQQKEKTWVREWADALWLLHSLWDNYSFHLNLSQEP